MGRDTTKFDAVQPAWIGDDARTVMKQALEDALISDDRPPASKVARRLGCNCATLRRYFPTLYRSVVARHRESFLDKDRREKVRQKMQEMYASSEETLSVSALAEQIGYSEDVLRSAFPEICKQFSARRRAKLRSQHEDRMEGFSAEIRQVMLELHGNGIYPSARRVTDLVSYKFAIVTKEGYNAWVAMLKQLGYR